VRVSEGGDSDSHESEFDPTMLEGEQHYDLKIMISKKKLFMENVQNFIERYRSHHFESNATFAIGVRGNTISLGFAIVYCILDSWCPELEIKEIRSMLLSDKLRSDRDVSHKLREYQNNVIVDIILGYREKPAVES